MRNSEVEGLGLCYLFWRTVEIGRASLRTVVGQVLHFQWIFRKANNVR